MSCCRQDLLGDISTWAATGLAGCGAYAEQVDETGGYAALSRNPLCRCNLMGDVSNRAAV